jgi:predicted amidohydrolase
MELKITLVQMDIVPSDPVKNLKRMEGFIKKAVKQGAQLVVFPEDAVTGPLAGQTAFVVHAPEYLAYFQGLAVKYGVDLVPGTWTVQLGNALYNTAYYINKDGSIAGSYHKINLWDTEKIAITPGSRVSVFPTAHGLVGLIICWDISFPLLFAEMNTLGVELVISPTYWSFTKPADEVEEVVDEEILLIDALCTTRAFENNIVFAYCNAAGSLQADGVDAVLSGRSQITHPHDKVVAKAEGNAERMITAKVKLDQVVA